MVHELQWPVVSLTTRGEVFYYIIDSRDEMEAYTSGLLDRIERMQQYITVIETAWERRHG